MAMSAAGRVGDDSRAPKDAHQCPRCPHDVSGGAQQGSPDVFINGKAALRVGDAGKHATCCGPNTWTAATGAAAVYFNGKKVHRLGDAVQHCGGKGKLVQGSGDVFIGDVVSVPGNSTGESKGLASTSLSDIIQSGGKVSPLNPAGFSIQLPLKGWVLGVLAGVRALAG